MAPDGTATEVYHRGRLVVTISGIPAVMVCPRCNNAIIEWEIAQQIEELVQPILRWAERYTLPAPTIAIAFPARKPAPAEATSATG